MAEYTPLTRENVKDILSRYSIGQLTSYKHLAGGRANSSYIVETESGRFILSVADEKNLKDAELLAGLLIYLEEHDYPTTRLFKTSQGELVTLHQEKPVYLKKYIEGEVVKSLEPTHLRQVGKAMAILHKIQPFPLLPGHFPYGLDFFTDVLDSLLNSSFKDWLEAQETLVKNALNPDLPVGFIHGDLFHDNMLFSEGQLSAVLDFEEACRYYLVFDIGMAITGCCSQDSAISLDKTRDLISGYQQIRELTDMEKFLLQSFISYAAAATAFWRFRQYHIRNPDVANESAHLEMTALADNIQSVSPREFQKRVFADS